MNLEADRLEATKAGDFCKLSSPVRVLSHLVTLLASYLAVSTGNVSVPYGALLKVPGCWLSFSVVMTPVRERYSLSSVQQQESGETRL